MKKVLLKFFVVSLLVLCACGIQNQADLKEESVLDSVDTAYIMQSFQSVLLNETAFSCTDERPYAAADTFQRFEGFLNEIPYGYDNVKGVCRFAIVDLDGDAIPEVVLELEEYYGYMILRYRKGRVYGNVLGYRSMNSINKEGVFRSESSAFEGWMQKLYFVGNTVVTDSKMHWIIDSNENRICYIDDIRVEKRNYEKANTLFKTTSQLEWHDYTENTVRKVIMEYQYPVKLEISKERQQYLDTLAYLIDMTYGSYQKTPEEQYIDGKNYYDQCRGEMNKIYQLCEETLSEAALEVLSVEQQQWEAALQEYMKYSIENNDIYYACGEIVFRRILTLINNYYDYDYYDWIN